MAKDGDNIVIKKVKKAGHGHHGGAWKVAYADFVTAMMAFFLLMWLLNATEAEQLAGLADYFAPTVGVSGEMGIGFRGGKAAISDGIGADINTNKGIVFGGVPTGPIVKVTEQVEVVTEITDDEKVVILTGTTESSEQNAAEEEAQAFSEAMYQLEDYIKGIDSESGLEEMIDVRQTIEGLEIQIKDSRKASMFVGDTAEIAAFLKPALDKIALVVKSLPNYVSIIGHATQVPVSENLDYSNWELSTERAHAIRRYLVDEEVQLDRMHQMVGKADNELLRKRQPHHPSNNRIQIILLKGSLLPHHKQVAPEGVFLDPESEQADELLGEDVN